MYYFFLLSFQSFTCTACPTGGIYEPFCVFMCQTVFSPAHLSSPSGLSQVQSSRGFPVCVPELRGDAEELKITLTSTQLLPSKTPGNSPCSPSPDPPTILRLHAVQEPLPAVLDLEAALFIRIPTMIYVLF